ncbi:MAG: RNA polymerase subunit sigma-54 [Pseudooceanicola sp.]|jgi:drug/metabolite transporter (DMT)-like permease|nr:RNA polymerase subunit sigma-54 [Pseudooceanicola sp.]|tara:strand:+ start:181 stop:1095 length:915 start_codon:yes stop_codon:yes gene_type:complete
MAYLNMTAARGAWDQQTPAMRGALLMIASTVAFATMHAVVRMVSAELPALQIAFLRNVFGFCFLLPMLVSARFAQLRTKRFPMHALRGAINAVAMLMFFSAIAMTPLAKVTALSFTAPIFAAALGVVLLGETFRIHRFAAIFAGFGGMLIVLRPGFAVIETGAVLAVVSAALWALAMIVIKLLSRTESSLTIVAWASIFLAVFSAGPAIWVWQWPTAQAWGGLVFIGIIGSIAQLAISQSFREADASAVLPFDFLKLIWTALLGAWLFGEIPDRYTLIGAGVIFGASLFIAGRERNTARIQAKL